MLLTLTATCLRSMLLPAGGARKPQLALEDLPQHAFEVLGLSGLNLSTDLLVGADRARLESIRERADKAGCAVLLLIESEAQSFAHADEGVGKNAVTRLTRVVEAARYLGCSAVAVKVQAVDDEASLLKTASRIRPAVDRAEKLDINVLLSPHEGLTSTPERVAEVIKRVGGFRIGTFPDFEVASKSKDPVAYLRRLCPYASAVSATTLRFRQGKSALEDIDASQPFDHEPYALDHLVGAVASVGYDGALAVDYRGPGDLAAGIRLSRQALTRCLASESGDAVDLDELGDFEDEDEEDEAVPPGDDDP